ncbi:SDR family NAD(P)-dependent oxidoreductase [Pyxidicoccus xibeiensis]|uniref:SDR family NAD(P)-dependent oxidoreductase n=1 Tax=Pyxidicoccus xibeiensis TaxID=2906759 RepID=UPI0020A81175|nr:SDR family oxidoreductase [Pyxidicoccus xibeiensis]MCP3140632.1 SDR family oxidoreductase [Pyxidicoccus xibeiensis]
MSGLSGRVALVTGGSRGIGAAIARRLAREGADVALTYVSAPEKAQAVIRDIQAAGRRGIAIAADSASPEAVIRAVEGTVAELGRLDILVNNAGIFPNGPLEEVTLEEVDRTLAIHVRAVFVAAQAAARHMGKGGRIISIGTCFSDRVPEPGVTLYTMSKSALTGLTRGLARDLGTRGITANVINPGPIDTDMNPASAPGAEAGLTHLAVKQFGEGEDIAATVAHLAGESGRFITGASIAVDGGFSA